MSLENFSIEYNNLIETIMRKVKEKYKNKPNTYPSFSRILSINKNEVLVEILTTEYGMGDTHTVYTRLTFSSEELYV